MTTNQFNELTEMELRDQEALYAFCDTLRNIFRDLAWALDFQADLLESDLATVPVPEGKYGSLSSKRRAKLVARCLRLGADASQHAARLSVNCYSLFKRFYLAPAEKSDGKPRFKLPA